MHIASTILQDSMRLSISLAYTKMGNVDSSEKNLIAISATPGFSVPSSELYVSLLIVRKEYNRASIFLNSFTNAMPIYLKEAGTSIKMLQNEPTQPDTNVSAYAPALLEIKHKYENPPDHSALLAGIYSTILPGMGKLYLGYKEEALSAFIENIALGAQAAESYYKVGPKSVRFIVTGSLFGLFYGGNIWGSVALAKKQKRDHRKQIEYEIYNYYNTRIAEHIQ
ncbi:MAG TPA: hypothetical protein VK783_15390 [Bacteroidia bacterium]|nr:hypothetical protein [Bacteroidia bacterium]